MAAKSERLKVEVKESTDGDVRTFSITLVARASDFLLTDLLKQRGVIDPLDGELKQAVKAAIERYLSFAENLVSALATKPKVAQQSRTNGNGNSKSAESVSGV